MNRLSSLLFPALFLSGLAASAQDVNEAYNLSNLTVQGTARSMGFGNALGSIGGDFSSLSVNPAGIGVYRNSEFTFTPSLKVNGATGQYLGQNTSDNNTRFNINNFGLVFTNAARGKRAEKRAWKAVSFGLGMNRVADFNYNYTYQGENRTSSATQAFESDANQNPGNDTTAGSLGYLGYQTYLLNHNDSGRFYSVVPFMGGINQSRTVNVTGHINEYLLSFGGNYKERLLLGVTIGIPSIYYQAVSTYTETLAADNNAPNTYNFQTFSYNNTLTISGTGVNAKLGAIYKFSDRFRIGLAFHSPTYYSIHDVFDPYISANAQGTSTILTTNDYLYENRFDYHFTSPWRAIASASYLFGSRAFITADYEYVDYSAMRYNYSDGYDLNTGNTYQSEQEAINQSIKGMYQAASNFRVGAEVRVTNIFMVRAGFGYYGSPYQSYDGSRIDLSAGLGLHFHRFFTDLAFVHSMYQSQEQPYNVDYSFVISGPQATIPTATINYSLNNVAWTIGCKF